MGALNLKNAHAEDSKAVKAVIRSTIRAAMDPDNPNYMITSIKLDFSRGPLLVGDDPRYVYRSPEMTIESIPIGPSPNSEADVSIATETFNSGTRNYAGGSVAIGEITAGTNPSMLNAMADGLPSENAYEMYRAYLKANDLTEAEYPFLPDDHDASHISQDDIVKWIEDGERATTSVPPKAAREVTSMNSFSTLESVSSSATSGKDDYAIREIADPLDDDYVDDDETLEGVTSLASVDESISSDDDFSDIPVIRTPHPDGTRRN